MSPQARIIRFPEHTSIGSLYLIPRDSPFTPFYFDFLDWSVSYSGGSGEVERVRNFEKVTGEIEVGPDELASLGILENSKLRLLERMAPDSLDALYFATSVTETDIPYFAHLSSLQYLGFSEHCGSDRNLSHASGLHKLTHLVCRTPTRVTDRGLSYISPKAPLTHLALPWTSVSGSFLADLAQTSSLRVLDLSGDTPLTEEGMENLSGLTSVVRLGLRNENVTDRSIANLSSLPNLANLDLCYSSITDDGLKHLVAISSLRYLDLAETRITDRSIPVLAKMISLRNLLLNNSQMTEKGVIMLREMLADCNVYFWHDELPDVKIKTGSNGSGAGK